MDDLRIPKDKVIATIHFDKDKRLEGTIYLGMIPGDSSVARKVSAFLEDEKEFVPFLITGTETTEFISKRNIKTVEWEETSEADRGALCEIMHSESVKVTFTDGEKIAGTLKADVPLETSRLSDCLNVKRNFLRIDVGTRHIHVNKAMLIRVTG